MASLRPLLSFGARSQMRPVRRRTFLVFLVTVCLLSWILADGHADDAAVGLRSVSHDYADQHFLLPTTAALLDLFAGDLGTGVVAARGSRGSSSGDTPPASPLPTHPVLILFIDKSTGNTPHIEALRAKVQQIATDIPSSVLRVHEYQIPTGLTERRLMELLLRGVGRLPALVLFPGKIAKVQLSPGSIISANPYHVPVHYSAKLVTSASYSDLRLWALSELPARYVDPVTFHLIPSLQFVFHHAEVRDTLRLVRDAVETNASRSVLPELVSMAYVRLTRHGSEEVVAALSSIATQAGNAVLTLVTESAEVAAVWGLGVQNTIATLSWKSAVMSYVDRSDSAVAGSVLSGVSSPRSISTVSELAEATAASEAWRIASAASAEATVSQLQAWREAMDAFNTTNTLRRIDSAAHLLHELTALQAAVKIVFVLRESDDMWFHHHLDVAAALSRRLQYTTVLYNTTEVVKGSKVRTLIERAWTPPVRYDVFWLDGEQLPAVADALHVSQVPSVLVVVPLQSRFRGRGAAEVDSPDDATADGEEVADASEGGGLRRRDPLIGIHTINRYDILRAAYTDDAQMAQGPISGKDALPFFPSNSDAILRFLSSGSFASAVQHAMSSTRLSALRRIKTSEWQEAVHLSTQNSGLSNRRYLQLDRRYYPLRAAEEPIEGPGYVRQILNGSSPLPVLDHHNQDSEAGQRQGGGSGDTHLGGTTTASPNEAGRGPRRAIARETAARLTKKKKEWEAELAKRRQEKDRRTRHKAAENEAVRVEQQKIFQEEVRAALMTEEAAAGGAAAGSGDGSVFSQGGLVVRRPTMSDVSEGTAEGERESVGERTVFDAEDAGDVTPHLRRRRRYREYREWQDDRQRMVNRCVGVAETGELFSISEWE